MENVKNKGGLPKGRTNNPGGRPKGSGNLLQKELKEALYDKAKQEDVINKAFIELKKLKGKDYLEQCRWLFRYIIPFAVSDEELDAIAQSQSALVSRLFRKNGEDE
jgi:hypothetical protein